MARIGKYIALLSTLVLFVGANEVNNETPVSTEPELNCKSQYTPSCIKVRMLVMLNDLRQKDHHDLFGILSVSKNPDAVRTGKSDRSVTEEEIQSKLPQDVKQRDAMLNNLLIDQASRFLKSYDLQIKVPFTDIQSKIESYLPNVLEYFDDSTGRAVYNLLDNTPGSVEGRKKKIKRILLLVGGAILGKVALLGKLLLGGTALVSLLALGLGLLALGLNALIILKKLWAAKQHHTPHHYESPHYFNHHYSPYGYKGVDVHEAAGSEAHSQLAYKGYDRSDNKRKS